MTPPTAGFFGKLPTRGDFVRAGLGRSFTDPWDAWMQRCLAGGLSLLGEAWRPAWLEAPIWRFALSPGSCGPNAAIGLWMPSLDRVGRCFPLTLALTLPGVELADVPDGCGAFLDAAEQAGLDAVQADLPPDALAARLAKAARAAPGRQAGPDLAALPPGGGLWWTDGSPRVPPRVLSLAGLPDERVFASMIDAACVPEETS